MLSVPQKMFLARCLNRSLRVARGLAGRDMQVRCRRNGIAWELDLNEGIDLSIYLLGAFEPRVLRAYTPIVTRGATVLDIGANIGAHTLHFAELAGPSGRVFAVEPTDYAIAKLRRNLALNPELAARVTTHQHFLVPDRSTPSPAAVPSSWPVGEGRADPRVGAVGRFQPATAAIPITADDFCAAQGIDRLDFVKIDVDGNEHSVLQGFRLGLERFRPTILIEFAPYHYDGGNEAEFDKLVSFLADLGYNFTDANSGRPIPRDPVALRRLVVPISGINALLHPASRGA
jgi:FkbM family methyltransferase